MAGAISQPRQSRQFLFCLMKNPLLYRSAWPESSREASGRFLMETLGRTQSERRRRLALAGGFRLLTSSGTDRLDDAGDRGGARVDKPRWVRILTITVGSSIAAMILKAPSQLGHCSTVRGAEHGDRARMQDLLRSHAQRRARSASREACRITRSSSDSS